MRPYARLISRLHSVFDPRDGASLALRVRHIDGLAWRVADDTLTLTVSGVEQQIALTGKTILGLKVELEAAGYQCPSIVAEHQHLAATALVDGDGDQSESNGDHLCVFTQPMAALMDALGTELERGRLSIPAALAQLILPDATNEWVNLFGRIFGIARIAGDSDPEYAQHIIREVKRARNNPAAMAGNIEARTGRTARIREPWKEVAYWSQSATSREDRLQGREWQYHYAQVVSSEDAINWALAQAQAQGDRPAGTLLLEPSWMPLARLADAAHVGTLAASMTFMFCRVSRAIEPRWSVSQLSKHHVSRVYPVSVDLWNGVFYAHAVEASIGDESAGGLFFHVRTCEQSNDTAGWYGAWDGRTWRTAPVVLSLSGELSNYEASLICSAFDVDPYVGATFTCPVQEREITLPATLES